LIGTFSLLFQDTQRHPSSPYRHTGAKKGPRCVSFSSFFFFVPFGASKHSHSGGKGGSGSRCRVIFFLPLWWVVYSWTIGKHLWVGRFGARARVCVCVWLTNTNLPTRLPIRGPNATQKRTYNHGARGRRWVFNGEISGFTHVKKGRFWEMSVSEIGRIRGIRGFWTDVRHSLSLAISRLASPFWSNSQSKSINSPNNAGCLAGFWWLFLSSSQTPAIANFYLPPVLRNQPFLQTPTSNPANPAGRKRASFLDLCDPPLPVLANV
jgi:hypothetical protein